MAVKVIVCGDQNGDYEFLVNSVERKRLFNEEILELFDSEGVLLYTVPVASLRLMQLFSEEDEKNLQPQKYQESDSVVSVCINNGNNQDVTIECTRVNAERMVNEVIIETFNYLGMKEKQEMWMKEFIIPIKQIKFINHNCVIEGRSQTPISTNEEVENTENDLAEEIVTEEVTEKPKKHKSKFIKK